ncbi:MAG: Hpt domain-containing protein [Pseudotabrizicola sp.]|uniref:Hpt domain-containing protein n=1 Tax=Pseudotabrizicola sp. TaxID=2939647 RepID=UPI0027288E4E|nr:Hpt domain-containing protein [Pseudotabrizicola sp.]MDO9639245.1 Hpt domain-containing protein [Pseudotabrizicola sp.]
MIDWARVDDLRAEVGADSFDEIVTLFLQETDQVVMRLPSLTAAGSLEHDLHFLKGSALNLGFVRLAEVCQTADNRPADVALDTVISIYYQSRAAFVAQLKASVA